MQQRIAGLQAIISADQTANPIQSELLEPQIENDVNGASAQMSGSASGSTRHKRGFVEQLIDKTLRENPELDFQQVSDVMKEKFPPVTIGRSTLYSNLQRGLESGKYQFSGGKWSIKS